MEIGFYMLHVRGQFFSRYGIYPKFDENTWRAIKFYVSWRRAFFFNWLCSFIAQFQTLSLHFEKTPFSGNFHFQKFLRAFVWFQLTLKSGSWMEIEWGLRFWRIKFMKSIFPRVIPHLLQWFEFPVFWPFYLWWISLTATSV